MLRNYSIKLFMALILLVNALSTLFVDAQTLKDVDKKLKNIEGNVNKIVVVTDKGEVEFKGKEAEVLLGRMKASKKKFNFNWNHAGDSAFAGEKRILITTDEDEEGDVMVFMKDADDDEGHKEMEKKVEVEVNDGIKKVTVTTIEDGKEMVKTYEGEEAEKFLEDVPKGEMIRFEFDGDEIGDEIIMMKRDKIRLDKLDPDAKGISKEINVTEEEGVKKVTIKTIKDGKETVETYEGKEAEEFIKKQESCDLIRVEEECKEGDKIIKIELDNDKDKKVIKIIKEKREKEKE